MSTFPAPELAGGRLTIDLGALAANWRRLRDLTPGAETGAVVKADAYGIGVEPAVRALSAAGCRTFFVALPDEGARVRAVAPSAVIYVLGGLLPGTAAVMAAHRLRPVLNAMSEIEEWVAFIRAGGKGAVGLHVDTGMNRLGLSPAEAEVFAARTDLTSVVAPAMVMSHLACADTPDHPLTQRQLSAFTAIAARFPNAIPSLANSAGVLRGREFHFGLTRPGIALYGAEAAHDHCPLDVVVTSEARILTIRAAAAGDTVGYGATQTLARPSRLAILGAGYADGYHRAAGPTAAHPASAYLHGRFVPLVGRISMDLIILDVTDLPEAQPGDHAELFGRHIPVDAVAARSGTIGYELLTNLSRRFARNYVEA